MKKFPMLHILSSLFKILAWISLGITLIMFIVTIVGTSEYSLGGGVLTGLLILIGGIFYTLLLFAFSEGILVVLAIEENTRKPEKEE